MNIKLQEVLNSLRANIISYSFEEIESLMRDDNVPSVFHEINRSDLILYNSEKWEELLVNELHNEYIPIWLVSPSERVNVMKEYLDQVCKTLDSEDQDIIFKDRDSTKSFMVDSINDIINSDIYNHCVDDSLNTLEVLTATNHVVATLETYVQYLLDKHFPNTLLNYVVTIIVSVNGYEKITYQLVQASNEKLAIIKAMAMENHTGLKREPSLEFLYIENDDSFWYEVRSVCQVNDEEMDILRKYIV